MERIFVVEAGVPFAQNTKIKDLLPFQIGAYGMPKHGGHLEPFQLGTAYDWIEFRSGSSFQESPTFDVLTNKKRSFRKVRFVEKRKPVWRFKIPEFLASANDTFAVTLSVVNDKETMQYKQYEVYQAVKGSKSKKGVYQNLADQINESEHFEASVDELGLVVTTTDIVDWGIALGGEFIKEDNKCFECQTSQVEVEELVKWRAGSGNLEQIQLEDERLLPDAGDFGDYWDKRIPSKPIYGSHLTPAQRAAAKFDLYYLEGANFISNNGDNGREAFEQRHTLIVAFDVSNTTSQNLFVKVVEDGLGVKLYESPLQ